MIFRTDWAMDWTADSEPFIRPSEFVSTNTPAWEGAVVSTQSTKSMKLLYPGSSPSLLSTVICGCVQSARNHPKPILPPFGDVTFVDGVWVFFNTEFKGLVLSMPMLNCNQVSMSLGVET